MNFDLSTEQQILKDSVEKFVDDRYSLEQRQGYVRLRGGFDVTNWQTMAELGWLGLPYGEADGGYGGTTIESMLVMEAFGKGLVVDPYLATTIFAGGLLARTANTSQRQAILPNLITGEAQATVAYAEQQSRFDLFDVATQATASADGFKVSGQKSMVINGGTATHFVVSVRTAGGQRDQSGITLLLVDADAEGLKVAAFPTVDGLHAAELTFKDVEVPSGNIIGTLDEGFPALQEAVMHATLAISAEAVGAMEMLYKDTNEYIQEREQFDHPLANFQVLRHRLVDMFMEYEQAKSLLYRATLEVQQHGLDAIRTVHALKHFIGKTGIMIGEHAVQTHGGMGVTEELRVGHYFKRLLAIDALFGNSDYHLEMFSA